jgi:hypothetical protein
MWFNSDRFSLMKIRRSLDITVDPGAAPGDLFQKFNIICSEARQALLLERRDILRDPYRLPVFFMTAGKYKMYEEVAKAVRCGGNRRPLSARELMTLNLVDPMIRGRHPVFAGDFVLEYEVCDQEKGGVVSLDHRWKMGSSAFHRGRILDSNYLFAMTWQTEVDKGRITERSFIDLVSNIDNSHEVLRRAGFPVETPRLMA